MQARPRLLIVDDEEQIRLFLRITLNAAGYDPIEASTGREAIEACTGKKPDLVLLDLGLPDISGIDVIRAVRVWTQLPIIVLSVRSDESDKVAALDAGANDYVQKPFGTAELLARIRASLRAHSGETADPVIEAGGLRIDIPAHEVRRDGQLVKLSPKEFDLLLVLARAAGRVCTHRHLLESVWGKLHRDDVQYLRVYVGQLREKLGDNEGVPKHIVNEPGIGYRLVV
ncbi:two-component system KDP operon response regulator KdpE [Povalibacter uvarum]|uniref:Two-component system KDP operon response regulator KdpE n=1 Tax=Povalibacter uvarum TaxID=732238 RepID=A0A841HP46_9GAMM|nr:response regulator [Povalibacter uvarum]MBB6094109.1 two-component system KDP operon response regulator KdpE [Povalibacter uvarum]